VLQIKKNCIRQVLECPALNISFIKFPDIGNKFHLSVCKARSLNTMYTRTKRDNEINLETRRSIKAIILLCTKIFLISFLVPIEDVRLIFNTFHVSRMEARKTIKQQCIFFVFIFSSVLIGLNLI
jgi:hypothetical protein